MNLLSDCALEVAKELGCPAPSVQTALLVFFFLIWCLLLFGFFTNHFRANLLDLQNKQEGFVYEHIYIGQSLKSCSLSLQFFLGHFDNPSDICSLGAAQRISPITEPGRKA